MKKISVTGTKGKTTVVNVVASVLQAYGGRQVLKVDTTGHYLNGVQKSSLEDSKAGWALVPTVCPGRYLWEFKDDPGNDNNVAVLECALGCSAGAGLGYRNHEVGVFLNVLEDHLGSSARLQTKADIAKAKSFIFRRVERNGYAVFNADDELVCQTLAVLPSHYETGLIPCGLDFKYFDVETHLHSGGMAVTLNGTEIVKKTEAGDEVLFDLKSIPWAFNGDFAPSVWNLLHVAGALLAYFDGEWPKELRALVEAARLDRFGGRLTVLKAENGARIIADYAHEKYSLKEIGKLAHGLKGEGGKVIGVVRLAPDRTDELIQETGRYIANDFDHFVVYDKIDGHWRQPKDVRSVQFKQVVGKISEVFAAALKEKNPNTERIMREDEAIQRAAKLAGPEDVVVVIVNDDIEQSIKFIQEAFRAEFA